MKIRGLMGVVAAVACAVGGGPQSSAAEVAPASRNDEPLAAPAPTWGPGRSFRRSRSFVRLPVPVLDMSKYGPRAYVCLTPRALRAARAAGSYGFEARRLATS